MVLCEAWSTIMQNPWRVADSYLKFSSYTLMTLWTNIRAGIKFFFMYYSVVTIYHLLQVYTRSRGCLLQWPSAHAHTRVVMMALYHFLCMTNLCKFIKMGLLINLCEFCLLVRSSILYIIMYGVIKIYSVQIYAAHTWLT